ncbi:MAG: hypothetical protein Q4D98_11450 [Planctomycetia bacterium]|nr:hypothetical protein [Planctomycetia bacterium]
MLPFEEYLYVDSQKAGTTADAMTVLVFRGASIRERWENAIAAAMQRSWLATARIQETDDGNLRWFRDQDSEKFGRLPLGPDVFRFFTEERTVTNGPQEPIDLTRSPGVRFWIYAPPETDRTEVVFQFHHVTTDALGSFRFLEEVLRHYADGTLPDRPTPDGLEIDRSQKMPSTWRFGFRAGLHAAKLLFRTLNPWNAVPVELRGTPETPPPSIPFVGKTCSPEETQQLLSEAKARGVTFNDLLLAAVFQSLPHFGGGRNALYRMAVPVGLRTDAEKHLTLANRVSIVFVEQTRRQCEQPMETLLASVARQMRNAKRHDLARRMLKELQWLHDWRFGKKNPRGGMRWFVNRKTPLETLIVSNLGVLFGDSPLPRTDDGFLRVGDLTLEDLQLYSPRTTGVSVTIPVGTYAGRLRMYVCYDPARLSADDATQLLHAIYRGFRTPSARKLPVSK